MAENREPRAGREVDDEVVVSLDDLLDCDRDEFNDLLCSLTQEPHLQDIFFRAEGYRYEDGGIVLRVTGTVYEEDEESQ